MIEELTVEHAKEVQTLILGGENDLSGIKEIDIAGLQLLVAAKRAGIALTGDDSPVIEDAVKAFGYERVWGGSNG